MEIITDVMLPLIPCQLQSIWSPSSGLSALCGRGIYFERIASRAVHDAFAGNRGRLSALGIRQRNP
jgi:hypothetical protein